jgi:hypothetical protein
MKMTKPQSKKAGKATNGCQIYAALAPLACKKCDATIQPGEHFTRPSLGGRPVTTGPVCRSCEAFEEIPVCPSCQEKESLWRYNSLPGHKFEFHCQSCGADFVERKAVA